jgi:hypothetical protein
MTDWNLDRPSFITEMFHPKQILRKTTKFFSLPQFKAIYLYQTYMNTILAEENVFSPLYKKKACLSVRTQNNFR